MINSNDKKIAEFVGIMLGDGYISFPKNQRIKISLNSIVDKVYLKYVYELLVELFNTNVKIEHRKNENTSDLFMFERRVIRHILNDIGLIPSPKWERARIPKWVFDRNLEKYALRGYFDTDGCVVIANNNGTRYPRLEMKISPAPMQEQFIYILNKLGFNFGIYDIGKGKVRIQINGKKGLKKWINLIGFSNTKHKEKAKLFN